MTDEKRRVLIVDDNADDIHVLMENLKQDYAMLAATSGEKALLQAAKDPQPDVILLDVSMDDMDGYETCRRLKRDMNTRDIDVIFVSAHDTTEEKLAGYDAGGCDYLIKPVQPSELTSKVKLAISNKDARQAAAAEKDMAMQTAMTAMSSASEQGVVLDFMRRSFAVRSTEELAQLVVEATSSYGLENSVQIRTADRTINVSSQGPMPPLEQELLTQLKDSGRIRERGARFIGNYGVVSQLIKNMPDDDDKRGRLRDHLAVLLEGAEARALAVEMERGLETLVKDSRGALQNIQAMQKMQMQTAMQIMDNVVTDLEESFMSYGLTEEQEEQMLKVVKTGVDKSLKNVEQGQSIDAQLLMIIDRLEKCSRV